MKKIIDFFVKNRVYFAFVILVTTSLILITYSDLSKIGGFRAFVVGTIGTIQNAFSWIPNPALVKSENQALRRLNLELSEEVTRMRQALNENKRLRGMLELESKANKKFIVSEVVGKSTFEMRNYITLNKGSIDGVMIGMAVRTDMGLIGVILGASENYSIVEMINNQGIRLAGRTSKTDVNGIVAWEGGSELALRNIPKSFKVDEGERVLTSNYSAKYPADIPIGRISKVINDPKETFLTVKLKPFVDFDKLEEAFIIEEIPDPERLKLIRDMDEKLMQRKTGGK